jgi:ABC-type multidrug transport system fused ATPase/permease subunit
MTRLLRRLAAEAPGLLATGVATAVAQAALLLPVAHVVRQIFDSDLPERDTQGIVLHGLLIMALYAATAVLGFASRVATLGPATRAAARLREDVVAKVHDLSQEWHDRQRAGLVHSMLVQDAQRVEEAMRDLANPLIPAVIVVIGLALVGVVLSPVLSLTLLVVLPISVGAAHLLARRSRTSGRRWAQQSDEFSSSVQLTLRGATVTKVEGMKAAEVGRLMREARRLAHQSRRYETSRAAASAVQGAIGAVAGSVVLVVGGVGVAHGSLTLGELLAFYAVLAILIRQLHMASTGASTVLLGAESLKRLERLLATPGHEPYDGGREQIEFRGGLDVEGVTFSYSERPVLTAVSLSVRPSDHVVVLGPNGAGKSTLVSLLVGLYRPQQGRVLADGVPFDELDMAALRRQIGVVLQDPVLFPGTVRENIAYARRDATHAEVVAAAEAATASNFIDRLPAGYDTPVGDEGVGLSGGQRQRLAIARALLGQPALLLLDEPTTYLDEASVTELMANLDRLPRAPTVLIVTHDPQAAAHAERTIELRDGRVVSDSQWAVLGSNQ